jgi:hypothetical protein
MKTLRTLFGVVASLVVGCSDNPPETSSTTVPPGVEADGGAEASNPPRTFTDDARSLFANENLIADPAFSELGNTYGRSGILAADGLVSSPDHRRVLHDAPDGNRTPGFLVDASQGAKDFVFLFQAQDQGHVEISLYVDFLAASGNAAAAPSEDVTVDVTEGVGKSVATIARSASTDIRHGDRVWLHYDAVIDAPAGAYVLAVHVPRTRRILVAAPLVAPTSKATTATGHMASAEEGRFFRDAERAAAPWPRAPRLRSLRRTAR